MANFNKVIIAGNLTRDPELRYTPKGTAIARFTLAVNRTWKAETGENREEVTFVDVDAFSRQAEVIAQYMRKGRPLLVEGRLKLDQWEDKTTHQKISKLRVVLETFSFLESGKGAGSDAGMGSGSSAPEISRPRAITPAASSPPPAAPDSDGPPPEDDDVPF